MGIRGQTRNLACLLFVAAGLTACAEEKASLFLDASVSSSTAGDGGGKSDGGAPTAVVGEKASLKIDDGELNGSVEGKTRRFLGIPYAKPPVEELRWKRPEKPAKWSSARDATKYGKRCAQNKSDVLQNPASADEDCLYLNVWAPPASEKKALPVMFWIHGGGNVNGSASEIVPYAPLDSGYYFYDGKKLAEKGVVVVTFNYRLGVFGFLSHPSLDEEDAPAGNQGMWDQVAALEWVKANIAKFGGDPKNVTIFGESAGSYDVCMLVASPKTQGLFHKAISQSGGCTTITGTKQQGEATSLVLATNLGCEGDDAATCLREQSVADLLAASAAIPPSATIRALGPTVDGDFMPDQPRTLFKSGEVNQVPYMLGSNHDEGTLFTAGSTVPDEAAFLESLKAYSILEEPLKELYAVSKFEDGKPNPAHAASARVAGDSRLVCTTTDTAILASAHMPVYTYNFNIPIDESLSPVWLGSTHGAELVYVFQTSPSFMAPQTSTSNLMQRYWTNFAKSGDPNSGDDPEWPTYSAEDDQRMNITLEESAAVSDFRKAECDLWRMGYEATFAAAQTPAAAP